MCLFVQTFSRSQTFESTLLKLKVLRCNQALNLHHISHLNFYYPVCSSTCNYSHLVIVIGNSSSSDVLRKLGVRREKPHFTHCSECDQALHLALLCNLQNSPIQLKIEVSTLLSTCTTTLTLIQWLKFSKIKLKWDEALLDGHVGANPGVEIVRTSRSRKQIQKVTQLTSTHLL